MRRAWGVRNWAEREGEPGSSADALAKAARCWEKGGMGGAMHYLRSIEFVEYGPFKKSGRLEFARNTSVLVAENGVGKTFALQAIQSLEFPLNRQRISADTGESDEYARIGFQVGVATKDLMRRFAAFDAVRIPLGQGSNEGALVLKRIAAHLERREEVVFSYERTPGGPVRIVSTDLVPYVPTFGQFSVVGRFSGEGVASVQEVPGMKVWTLGQPAEDFIRNIHRLDAERFNIGSARIEGTEVLRPDGANLSAVVNHMLTNNLPLFQSYLENVRSIIPHVMHIQAPVEPGDFNAILKVWNHRPETMRADLAIPVKESGTGVAQILALVYVLTTAGTRPRTVLLDEPQAFLHPRALRNLLALIKRTPEHQYIIATHAPSVLSILRPDSIVELRRTGGDSPATEAVCYGPSDLGELRSLLTDLDVRWSELFGADVMVWVEGPTEAACFPLIIVECERRRGPVSNREIRFVPVRATGDFDSKRGTNLALLLGLYSRVSHPQLVLPPRVVIVLDDEARGTNRKSELESQAKQAGIELRWLGKTMYEDFLLSEDALGALLGEHLDETYESASIAAWVERWRKGEMSSAEALAGAVQDVTNARWSYDKVRHGRWLTGWVIRNKLSQLEPLIALLTEIAT